MGRVVGSGPSPGPSGDAAAWPVQSFLKHFRPEFEAMARTNVDPVAGGIAA